VLLAALMAPATALGSIGDIFTIAGGGTERELRPGFGGDGGPATDARLKLPFDVAALPGGGYLIADTANRRIRRVSRLGRISTVAGSGRAGSSGDGGPARRASFQAPFAVAVTPDGGYLVSDEAASRIRRVSADGKITTVAGTGRRGFSGDGGPALRARLRSPGYVTALTDGGFLFADSETHRIRQVTAAGTITTVAGSGPVGEGRGGFAGDGEPALRARLNTPAAADVTPGGALLIADSFNHRVRRVSPSGRISTVAGSGPVGVDAGRFRGDGGRATRARLGGPTDIEPLAEGGFLIADSANARVRVVLPSGRIRTLAGSGRLDPRTGDGRRATRASLIPLSIDFAGDGLLISDPLLGRIRYLQLTRTRRLAIALVPEVTRGPRFAVDLVATLPASARIQILRGEKLVARARGVIGRPFRFPTLRPGRYTIRVVARTRNGQIATARTRLRLTAPSASASASASGTGSGLVIR
jgi:DNA-binding beta-propeller fold protein YncE